MLYAPDIDPVIFQVWFLQIRWYSMMYVIGLLTVMAYFRYSSRKGTLRASIEQIETIMVCGLLGMIIGARTFYVLFYNLPHYAENPLEILAVWKGGLSFHGAVTGICVAIMIYCYRNGLSFLNVMDHIAVSSPVGLFFGRIGNFINGELYGRVADPDKVPWAMVFPTGGPLPRHPSQLYESFGEGLILLIAINLIRKTNPRTGVLSGCFVLGYGLIRFCIEFFRQPDAQLGFVLGPFSMGQILCAFMWAIGGVIIYFSYKLNSQTFSPSPKA